VSGASEAVAMRASAPGDRPASASARPLRALYTVAPADFGGLESVLRLLATGMWRRGHEVHVAAAVEREGDARGFCDALRDGGVDVTRIVMPARAYAAERRAIRELCARIAPEVVHSHGYRSDILHAGAARALGIPTVTTAHGFAHGNWRNRLNEWVQRRVMRRFDAVVAVSRPLVTGLVASGIPQPRVHLLPNAYAGTGTLLDRAAARRRLDAPEGVPLVGWVGRLGWEKGADVLVDALARLPEQVPLHVAVIGDGPDRAMLEARAISLGVAHRITWHGRQSDAASLFGAFDLFVLSSRTEGTPMVLFEAMAAGVPAVVTRVGGVPDVVSAREALLVPAEDPAALAAAMRETLSERAEASGRAAAARTRLETQFGTDAWLDRHEALYAAVRRTQRTGAIA
jgi:glycosyltransferase involved in cell wall biosynthesis